MAAPTYSYASVPEREGPGSRFALSTTPAGWGTSATASIASAYESLLSERQREAVRLDKTVTVPLRKVVLVDGAYGLVDAGTVTAEPSLERPKATNRGRFEAREHGGAFLDAVFLGERIGQGKDADVWNAALELAQAEGIEGNALRAFNIVIARLVCLRNGIAGRAALPENLPLYNGRA